MSEPEKLYTLAEAVKAVRDHAEALGHAAEALRVTEGNDPTILALLGERTGEAEAELWAIENTALADEGLSQAWDQHSALWSVPIVSLAIQALVMGHDTERGTGWMYCQYHAEQIAKNLMAWVTEHEKDAELAPTTETNGTGAVSPPEEPREPESEQLMPTEAFEAMADALRPLASGLGDFTVASEVYSCFVDAGDTENCKLTDEGIRRIDELASTAADGARRLDHALGSMLHRYLPDWCESQLTEVNLLVERIAWILYGAAAAVDDGSSPERPKWAAVHGYDMARDAYRDLCAKFDEYTTAEKVAIDKQYEDMGYIKQPNGEWHPTPEMLKEMEASP